MVSSWTIGVPPATTEQLAEVVQLHPEPPRPTMPAGASSNTEMDRDIAANWELWSGQIGRALLPILHQIVDTTPEVTSAMIGTADGFNLCAIGLEEDDIARVSAMTSSLLSLADAVTDVVDKADDHPLDVVTVAHGPFVTVMLTVPVAYRLPCGAVSKTGNVLR